MSMIPYKRNEPTALGQGGLYPLTVPEPSLGEVIDASVQEAWFGVGTGYADSVDYSVNEKMISGTPIDEQTFNRDFSRYGISYIDGITAEAAQELANYHIDRNQTSQTLSAATSGDYVAGMAAGFAVGIVEPKNLAYGAATSLALSPFGGGTAAFARSYRRIQQLRRAGQYTALKAGDYAALAGGGAVEGMVSAAIMEPSNRDTAQTLQMDYTMADSLWNVGLSTVLGAGLTSLPPLARAKYDKWKGRTHEIVAHEIDLATEQLVTGQKVDVTPVEKLAVGEVEKLPVAEQIAVRNIDLTADKYFNPDALSAAKKQNNKSRDILIYLTPSEFLSMAKTGMDKTKVERVKSIAESGKQFSDIPQISFENDGNGFAYVTGHEGRHRAMYLQEKGVANIPVILRSTTLNPIDRPTIRWGELGTKSQDDFITQGWTFPYKIKQQDGDVIIDFPIKLDETVANSRRIDAENQAALSKAATESLSPYSSTAIDKAAIDTLNEMPLTDKPDYAKQYDSSVEKMRAMVDEGTLSKEEFDAFMDAADNNNEADTLEALKDLETCLAGLV